MLEFLPMFPLQLVVFPGEDLNLHIFEPRYRQLINESESTGQTFGIIAYIDSKMMAFGTEVRLEEVSKRYSDGKLDIKTKGVGVFQTREYYSQVPDKLYSGADVERLRDSSTGDIVTSALILDRITELFVILKINKEIPETPNGFRTFDMGHHVGFSLKQEYDLLRLRSEQERQIYMLNHLENLIPIVREMENLRKRVQMNGHFKNVIPPQV